MNPEIPLARLAALAAGLCQDAAISLEVSEHTWAWDPIRRVILVPGEDLRVQGPDYCAGVLAHEVSHSFISRYHLFPLPFPSRIALSNLLNGIEDPRVNTWIRRRYPGTTDWQRHMTERDARQPVTVLMPEFFRFVLECAREELLDWQRADSVGPVPPRVMAALDRTRATRQAYAELLPSIDLEPDLSPEVLATRYREEVWPRVQFRAAAIMPLPWEQMVRLRAWEALELASRTILPEGEAILRADLARIGRYLQRDPRRQRAAREAVDRFNREQLGRMVQEALGTEPEPPTTELPAPLGKLALELFEAWLAARDEPQGGGMGRGQLIEEGDARRARPTDGMPKGGRPHDTPPPTPPRLPQSSNSYDRAMDQVAPQIDRLVLHLEDILLPRRRLREISGFPNGHRLDLRRVLAYEADPRLYNRLWLRKSIPERRDTAISLLVDLSGSMRGPKAEAALVGTVLLAETLHRLGVPFAVNGFQDVLIPFCKFGEGLTPDIRQSIGHIPLEIEGTRPGGNNQPSWNDDGPCLREAAEGLLEWSATDHVLLVVSDGQPEGRRSNADDLRKTIAALREEGDGLKLIGVGLGPNTGHVKEYYPESVADVPVEKFADEIGALLRRSLLGEHATI